MCESNKNITRIDQRHLHVDDLHPVFELIDTSGGVSPEIVHSQDLFSVSECLSCTDSNSEREVTVIPPVTPTASRDDQALDSDASSSGGSLFQTQYTCSPTRTTRKRGPERPHHPTSPLASSSEDSSDYEPRPKKLSLKEIFDQHFNKKTKKKKKKKKKWKKKKKRLATEKNSRKPLPSVSLEEKRRRRIHRGIQFPFTANKYLPLTTYFAYEQSVFGGFLKHLKKLKCENHLETSLRNMDAGTDLDNENLETRRYKYMDDEGPISPISEPDETITNCDQDEPQDYDAKIVENSSFILNCQVPSKENWCKKKRKIPRAAAKD
ncbi:TATA box-binding protein-associated factor RNA polymerase I subunit D isoform X2 [Ascaphus truei]|uniref:TATA box-binding protein-associated factor RNA polymerase I subunit D isoform X2 n=1 Tax=Ascaphus truei TaxID=8439 RepID=UPI003F59A9A0